jgi:hypothetical protein
MQTVRLTLPKHDVATKMQEMRSWLDAQRLEPSLFTYRVSQRQAHVEVRFSGEREAMAFADRFEGRRLDLVG